MKKTKGHCQYCFELVTLNSKGKLNEHKGRHVYCPGTKLLPLEQDCSLIKEHLLSAQARYESAQNSTEQEYVPSSVRLIRYDDPNTGEDRFRPYTFEEFRSETLSWNGQLIKKYSAMINEYFGKSLFQYEK